MSNTSLSRSRQAGMLSAIGGAAQGGSAKPKEEREQLDREHGQPQEDNPSGAGGSKGVVGGTSNDSRTDSERSSDVERE